MTAPQFLLALDQGTSSSRSIVFDARGQIVAMAQREFRQIYPQPGWVEHDPAELWSTQLATAQEALAKAGVSASQLAGIGITNQRETTVVWNRSTGQPIYNAIVWQDRRAEPTCAALRSWAQVLSARRSCQTMAWCTGWPVVRFHSTVVSRWLVIPMARISLAFRPAVCNACRAVASCVRQISIGSCSTQPGRG